MPSQERTARRDWRDDAAEIAAGYIGDQAAWDEPEHGYQDTETHRPSYEDAGRGWA